MQTHTVNRPGWGTAILLAVVGGLVGGLVGCLGVYAFPAGLFNRWRELPEPPAPLAAIAGVTVETVDARTATGDLLRFDLRVPTEGWLPVDNIRAESDPDCARFAEKAPPIRAVREQLAACLNLADAGTTTVFALREDGRVAYWTRFDSAYGMLAALIFVPLGAGLLGTILGLVLFWLLRRRQGG